MLSCLTRGDLSFMLYHVPPIFSLQHAMTIDDITMLLVAYLFKLMGLMIATNSSRLHFVFDC